MNGSNSNNDIAAAAVVAIPCELHVVHFDHKTRGEESDGDRIFVESLCEKLHIPCHTYYWADGDDNEPNKEVVSFSHDTARLWRRRTMQELVTFLTGTIAGIGTGTGTGNDVDSDSQRSEQQGRRQGIILTAHHRDDSAETLLLKLLRGVHLTNISGIKPAYWQDKDALVGNAHTGHGTNRDPVIMARPLLRIRKNDIQRYLVANDLEWREDSSNASNKYKRNQVRNQLVPLLEEMTGGEEQLLVSGHKERNGNRTVPNE